MDVLKQANAVEQQAAQALINAQQTLLGIPPKLAQRVCENKVVGVIGWAVPLVKLVCHEEEVSGSSLAERQRRRHRSTDKSQPTECSGTDRGGN